MQSNANRFARLCLSSIDNLESAIKDIEHRIQALYAERRRVSKTPGPMRTRIDMQISKLQSEQREIQAALRLSAKVA